MRVRGQDACAASDGPLSKSRSMNVKVDADLVRKAKVVAAVKNITLSRYVTELVRSRVENDLAVVAAGLTEPLTPDASSLNSNGQSTGG